MSETDQPRPDLDAAIDAALPSLTAVSDAATASSLRRTRTALADAAPQRQGVGMWRWGVAAAAAATVIVATAFLVWHGPAAPRGEVASTPRPPALVVPAPVPAPAPLGPSASPSIATAMPRPDVAPRRTQRVRATATPRSDETPRPDRLDALVQAVQQIPEDAWQRSAAQASSAVYVPDVSFSPIDVAPLETPPLTDTSAEPVAPGEP